MINSPITSGGFSRLGTGRATKYSPTFSPFLQTKWLSSRTINLVFHSGGFTRTAVAELIVALQRVLEDFDQEENQ